MTTSTSTPSGQGHLVTRGAVYHHFRSRKALFEAVLAQVQAGLGSGGRRPAQRPALWIAAAADPDAAALEEAWAGLRRMLAALS